MTDRLPAPTAVPGAAADVARDAADGVGDADVVNVVVSGARFHGDDGAEDTVGDVEHDDGAYRGPSAGALGRLAATTSALEDWAGACLHYPDPDFTAPGPWLVVEPLAERLATVARGRATVTVELDPPRGHPDARLRACRDRLDRVIEAARPRHDYYPVARDETEAFTRGLPEFELRHVSVGDEFTTTFDALTIPHSGPDQLQDRFQAVDGVERVTVTVETDVEHANPTDRMRVAVEDAAAAVVGDWNYEWLPEPSAFSAISSGDKLALGTGEPGAGRFGRDAFATGRELLTETITNLAGDRS